MRYLLLLCAGLVLLAPAGPARAQAERLDVPYVPTPPQVVDAMLKLGEVGSKDYLIDLGSGDGRIGIAAAKRFGTRGFGVDIDGGKVSEARRAAAREGVQDRVEFFERNLFVTDIERASVLTLYLLHRVNLQLRPRLFAELKPGTRVVSHDFDMGDWRPDAQLTVPVPGKPYGPPSSDVFLWVVPANAAGRWSWRLAAGERDADYEVTFEQRFQTLEARAAAGGRNARVTQAALRGAALNFSLVTEVDGRPLRHEFVGRVSGDTISGRVAVEGRAAPLAWEARRVAPGRMRVE